MTTGGTVLKVAGDNQDRLWVASPAGLFRGDDLRWQMIRRGVSFWRVNTVCVNGRYIWVAGMPGGIIRSTNGGKSWNDCWIEQTEAPIMSIATSPNFATDRILLAATDGDGILRSTDGGRYWQLSNFGLRDFAVLDVVMAPQIGRYEHAFAISESGFYQSPNGGRAWQQIDLGEVEPVAMAISPTFVDDKTVWLGTQDGELFKSEDAGEHFSLVSDGFEVINALTFAPDGTLLIGTMDGVEKLQSPLAKRPNLPSPVLSLNVINGAIYAGLWDGLSVSEDNGRSWNPIAGLTARRLTWYLPSGNSWLAAGLEDGLWRTDDSGQRWQPIWDEPPVFAITTANSKIWASGLEGVAVSDDGGETWQPIWEPELPITALAVANGVLWAGDAHGQMWQQRGDEWHIVQTPFAGQQFVGFVTPTENRVLAVSWSSAGRQLQLWLLAEDGAEWTLWFGQKASAVLPQVAIGEAGALIGLGSYVYLQAAGGKRQKVTGSGAPVTAVCATDNGWLVAITDTLLSSSDGANWTKVDNGLLDEAVVSLKWVDGEVVAGTADGRFFISSL